MMKLWELSDDEQKMLVESALSKYGCVVRQESTPHSIVYFFDQGDHVTPRFIVAKAPRLSPEIKLDEQHAFMRRLILELNNAYQVCHHSSIQRFFHAQIILGVPFVLSRMRDTTLGRLITDGGIPLLEAVSISIQLVHALLYASGKGIICHQDLKPDNVFIDLLSRKLAKRDDYPLENLVHVADFELANAYLVMDRPYGSRPYMAPEQYRSKSLPNSDDFSRVDVFAVGVMLFEMLTDGLHPVGKRTSRIWPQPSAGESKKWLRENPWKTWLKKGAPIDAEHNFIDEEVLRIISDCLCVTPTLRPSKSELEGRLLSVLRRLDQHAYQALEAVLEQFDSWATEEEEGGWPYYEELLSNLNHWFDTELEGRRHNGN